jgi:hypothetical protein
MGGLVPIWITSPADEASFKLQAKLRTRAVGYKGGLIAFAYETWILGERSEIDCPV